MGGYRFLDSYTRAGILHKSTNTRLRIIGSNAKTAMGLVGCPWAILDEPGSWETRGGELLHDAIQTAMGKPGSPLRAVYIGTLAPAESGWWHDLIDGGSYGPVYVQSLQCRLNEDGDPEKWDQWPEIRRCNPLTAISPEFRKTLLAERDKARLDSRLKARFLSYRLNLPSADVSVVLLTVDDWKRALARPVTERRGRPAIAIDLGHGRAWSTGVAIWETGRIEAVALAPGIPSLEKQEKRDRVPTGTYQRLFDSGQLRVSDGRRVQPVSDLISFVTDLWGRPSTYIADRFRVNELADHVGGVPVIRRMTRWSESGFDIRALRKLALDGPLSVSPASAPLVTASLAVARVKPDDSGNVRFVKKGADNCARDDVAAALILAAGLFERSLPARRRWRSVGAIG
ncbi:MAG: hypothetical protein OXE42_01320 [Gammaproteobacteria bacterium]|nr:hypothetical protein [Gammaproteobacteria bacterium]